MAVFTQVTLQEAQSLIDQLMLGQALGLKGIEGGIENTNYFLDCTGSDTQAAEPQRFVLTLFERLGKVNGRLAVRRRDFLQRIVLEQQLHNVYAARHTRHLQR